MIKCDICEKEFFPMDMHNKEVCKVCWLKEYKKGFEGGTKKMLAARFGK